MTCPRRNRRRTSGCGWWFWPWGSPPRLAHSKRMRDRRFRRGSWILSRPFGSRSTRIPSAALPAKGSRWLKGGGRGEVALLSGPGAQRQLQPLGTARVLTQRDRNAGHPEYDRTNQMIGFAGRCLPLQRDFRTAEGGMTRPGSRERGERRGRACASGYRTGSPPVVFRSGRSAGDRRSGQESAQCVPKTILRRKQTAQGGRRGPRSTSCVPRWKSPMLAWPWRGRQA